MMKFVGARIKDPRILRLVRVMLKAGVVKELGGYEPTEQGSGQGSVCSPILSCIYMHYVLFGMCGGQAGSCSYGEVDRIFVL